MVAVGISNPKVNKILVILSFIISGFCAFPVPVTSPVLSIVVFSYLMCQ